MSVKVINACKSVDVPPTAKLVLFMLAEHAHDDGSDAFPSVGLIAWETGLSERAVRNSLRTLEAAGVIEVAAKSTRRRPTTYRVVPWRGVHRPPYDTEEAERSGGHAGPSEGHLVSRGGHDVPLEGHQMPPNRQRTVTEPSEEPSPALRAGASVEIISETPETPTDLAGTGEDALPARTRQRDPIFETVAAVCFSADDLSGLTSRERGMANRACKELRAVGATPEDIAERAAHFVAWVGQRPTPDNLVTHWNRLREPVQKLPRHELDALAEEQAMAARMRDAQVREWQRAAEAAGDASATSDRQIGDGYEPPPLLSDTHPRREGEPMRDYIRRINRIRREAG